jgi:hypothetical protein
MCKDFALNFGDKRIWLFHDANTLPFLPGNFFYQKQHDGRPHPPYLSLFFRLKIKLKVRYFDTIEVYETESQAMLNTLTEHNFQDAFKI